VGAIVDTNVLIDLTVVDPPWTDWSASAVLTAARREELIINQIIYAEFATRYSSKAEMDEVLDEDMFRREDVPWEAAFMAGRAFRLYRDRGGPRTRTLPDFIIGAHAAVMGYSIITRDPAGYRSYFEGVPLVTPETHP
jgi:predicted nucleic acid-binding protein